MPLCLRLLKKSLLNLVIHRFDKKLSSWNGKYLFFGGRITMLKYVFASLLVYFLFYFKCLSSVIKHIEKIQRHFLRNDSYNYKKYHLVRWDVVFQPIQRSGLDIRSIVKINCLFKMRRMFTIYSFISLFYSCLSCHIPKVWISLSYA